MPRISDTDFIVLDVETTGLDPKTDRIVEFAATSTLSPDTSLASYIDPERDIPPEASGVHHVTARHVAGKPTIEVYRADILEYVDCGAKHPPVIVAHNAPFDRSFLPFLDGYAWLDTLRFAKHLYPTAPNHKLQTLRYFLGIKDIDTQGHDAHSALGDVLVLLAVFKLMLADYKARTGDGDLEGLLAYIDGPLVYTIMPLGKYRGEPLAEIARKDPSYYAWAARTLDDKDLAYSLRLALAWTR